MTMKNSKETPGEHHSFKARIKNNTNITFCDKEITLLEKAVKMIHYLLIIIT